MNTATSRYNTICSSKKSGDVLFEADLRASSMEEAEARAYVTCVRAGNNYDEVRIITKKIGIGPSVH